MADLVMTYGDTLPELTGTVEDAAGNPVNIYGATVELVIRQTPYLNEPSTVLLSVTAENLDQDAGGTNRGEVRYLWQAGDTLLDPRQGYGVRWVVTYNSGDVETFPNDRWRSLAIYDAGAQVS